MGSKTIAVVAGLGLATGAFSFEELFPRPYDLVLLLGERELDRLRVSAEGARSLSLVARDSSSRPARAPRGRPSRSGWGRSMR